MSKKQKISGKVLKKGRKWLKVVVNEKNENYPDDLLINDITKDFTVGGEFIDLLVDTEFERTYTGRYKITHTAMSEEKLMSNEISKWWGYIQKNYTEAGYIYKKGVEELHKLDCHEYDEEIAEMQRKLDVSKSIRRIRLDYKEGQINQKHIDILHQLQCYEYDEEIAEMQRKVDVSLERADGSLSKNKVEVILERADLNDRQPNGALIRQQEKVYQIQSSRYDNGISAGTPFPNYYYSCIDVTNTEKGQSFLEKEKMTERKRQELATIREIVKEKFSALTAKIKEEDILNASKTKMPNGTVILDTFNLYGTGEMLIEDNNNYIWYIVNNGSDGSRWDMNNIETNGAGAYGWKCSKEQVSVFLAEYVEARTKYEYKTNEVKPFL